MIPEETKLRSSPNVSESEPLDIPPHPRPKTLNKTQRYEGTRWVAGEGPERARVMFVATSVLQEEEIDHTRASYGIKLFDPPRYLKGPAGQILSNLADQTGLDMDSCYYTSICKWLLPKPKRTNPSKTSIDAGLPLLLEEISRVNPDIIVCLGKPVFDNLYGQKFKLNDIAGGWFTHVISGRLRRLYPMEDVTKLVTKPEYVPRFTMDLKEVSRMLRRIDGVHVGQYEEKYEVIHNSVELHGLTQKLTAGQHKILSVDCEWHGENHMVGQLRSLQICWAPGEAAYIRFMDDQLNYVFDVSYREAGAILSPWLDREDVKYVGHHIAADLPWMHSYLGLEWFDKGWFDTEFGQQCVEESSELGLERLGMAYSDLGRYDVELTRWCKKNSAKVKDGYGLVPDHILIRYAMCDVDIVMRSYPHIIRQLEQDYGGRAYEYYRNIFNPFVTNVFTSFTLYGLPVNRQRVDHLRDLYQWARREMLEEFRVLMVDESEKLLLRKLMSFKETPEDRRDVVRGFKEVKSLADSGDIQGAKRLTFELAGPENAHLIGVVWDHFERAPEFNANSVKHVGPWLFDVKGYTPVKSTTNKAKGIPSVPWETVMGYDPDKRKEFNPSADKQTVEILAQTHEDPTLLQLMAYKSVDTVCKSFLGEPDEDEDGNVIREKGIHAYITPGDILVSNTSCTETGRPRFTKRHIDITSFGSVRLAA